MTAWRTLLPALLLLRASSPSPTPGTETLTFGAFGRVTVYSPTGQPRAVVLLVSGDGGWTLGVVRMAQRLRAEGALVAGIDIRSFLRGLERARGACAYPAGDLEELSRAIQLRHRLPEYRPPILVGYSSGATLVYAALGQAPVETFAGGISLGFCPDLAVKGPLCKGRGLASHRRTRPPPGYDVEPFAALGVPWVAFQGNVDQVCDPAGTRAFVEKIPSARLVWLPEVGHGFSVTSRWEAQFVDAYRRLAAPPPSPPPPSIAAVADLPLIEVPARGGSGEGLMAVILTGDGGWAEIDKGIADGLAARGVAVVGWSSLRYYWKPRSPEESSADLARVLRHYLAAWNRQRTVVIGYSFGADIAPFLVSRLPSDLKSRVAEVALLGLSEHASFEFHVAGWLGIGGKGDLETRPEVERLAGVAVLCLQGMDEDDSACHRLPAHAAHVVTVPGGHHFGGDYGHLAAVILDEARARARTGGD